MRRRHSQLKVLQAIGNRNNRALRIAIATAAFLAFQNNASARCMDDWLSVDEIRDGENIELRATNQQEFPITYSVRVRSSAIRNGRSKTVSRSLDGQQSERIMLLAENADLQDARLRISCWWTIGDEDAVHDDDHLYRLPYADGTSYRVLQGFGSRFSHRGIEQYAVDFKMSIGTPVHAARDGVVARVIESNDRGCWQDGCGQYANFIVIMHDDGTTGEYYHLQQNGAFVEVGEQVVAGQKIGLSGNTGHTALPHLHFAVYRATRGGQPQSVPVNFISADGVVYRPRRGHHYLAVDYQQAGD